MDQESCMSIKTLCLGALSLQDSTGYDIKKLFDAAFSHFHSASYGAIYPALKQLEEADLVACRLEAGDRHPDRKRFHITAAGQASLLQELTGLPASETCRSDFLVLLFFAHLLPTEVLAAKLDEIESYYRRELDYLESLADSPEHTAGIAYTIEHGIRTYRAKLQLLSERREALLAEHAETPASWKETASCCD
jgi:DNA-binding PadR family transcriptional regulator